MKISAKLTLGIMLLLLLSSNNTAAQEASQAEPIASVQAEVSTAPNISEIIPMAAELSGRLAVLENDVLNRQNLDLLMKKYPDIQANLDRYVNRLNQLKKSGDYRTSKLRFLKQEIQNEEERLEIISKSIKKEVSKRAVIRKEWLTEKERWTQWSDSLGEEGLPDQLKPIFAKVNDIIEKGLSLSGPQMEIVLGEQEKIGILHEKIYALKAEINKLIEENRLIAFQGTSPPMFSGRYFSQFTSDLWSASLEGVDEIVWSGIQDSVQLGWIFLVQGIVIVALTILICRKRQILNESIRWSFLVARPFSASVFFVFAITLLIYEYEGVPPVIKLINVIVGGIAFARVVGGMTQIEWKRQFIYGLMGFLIVNQFIQEINFPLPLSRLYMILAGAASLFFCWRWSRESDRHKESPLYTALLRFGIVFFAVIIIAQIAGQEGLSFYLFIAMIRSIPAVLAFILLNRMIHGGLQWLFQSSSPLRQAIGFYGDDMNAVIFRLARIIGFAFAGLILLPGILMIWGAFDSMESATEGFWAFELRVGSLHLTLGHLIIAVGVMYGSLLASWSIQKFYIDIMLRKRQFERGVRLSIERLIHYFVLFVCFLLAISILGFDVTKFTIILSALGVGIGFGLQSVVNNFVSGLILLFEQPVRQGDIIEVGGIWAEVKNIGLRATTVMTFDQADLIIPNADLTTNQVTNWTLSSRQVRLIIPVGVAYGSDVPLVFEILTECAKANEKVAKEPEPVVLFLRFGESSLDFELRVWIIDTDYRLMVKSQLHQEIDRRFREKNIVIAFPQRDLHLRSVDESAILRMPESDT